MKQSRKMSMIESFTNVAVGYGIACLTQIIVFPLFNIHTTLKQNLFIGAIFTVISIVRSYILRRIFEHYRGVGHA